MTPRPCRTPDCQRIPRPGYAYYDACTDRLLAEVYGRKERER